MGTLYYAIFTFHVHISFLTHLDVDTGHLTALVLMDFGENYSFHMQDEAQGYQMTILCLLLQVQLKLASIT